MDNNDRKIITIGTEEAPRHSVCSMVWRFFSFIGAALTFIRNFIANAVMLLVIGFIVIAYNAASSFKDEVTAAIEGTPSTQSAAPLLESKVVAFDLSGTISVPPLASSGFASLQRQIEKNLNGFERHELLAIEKALQAIKDDKSVECVLLMLDDAAPMNLAAAKRLASAVAKVREAGKRVIATAMTYSQTSFLIAAAASEIALDPIGEIYLNGLSMQTLYYRELLDKAMITPYVFRAGQFKSAVEPYLFNSMSEDVKAEYQELANSLWSDYETAVGSLRPVLSRSLLLPPDAASYVRSLDLYHGDKALMQYESNLADSLLPTSAILSDLAAQYGEDPDLKGYPLAISYQDYLALRVKPAESKPSHKVAVLYGLGTITDMTRDAYSFTPDNLVPLIDDILNDGDYEAVVLYLDSPGGMVQPSELMRRKLIALKEAGIPVYISINGTGASGAYMIASAGSKIFATSDSLVGSIGVFAVGFGVHNLLNHFGVTGDGVATHDLAAVNPAKPLSAEQARLLELSVENTYTRFIDIVAKARSIAHNDYLDYAEGQVFTAAAAQNLGLIDKVATFEEALTEVAADLGTERSDLKLEHLIRQDNPNFSGFEELFFTLSAKVLPLEFVGFLTSLKEQESLLFNDQEIMALSPLGAPKL